MPNPLDVARHDDRAGEKAGKVGRHDGTGGVGGEALDSRSDTQQGALQPVAKHDEADSEQSDVDVMRGFINFTDFFP